MITETEITELKTRFAEMLEEDYCTGGDPDDIVRTADSANGFAESCREYRKIDTDTFEGHSLTIIEASQRFKGEARRDVYVLEVEENISLVYAS